MKKLSLIFALILLFFGLRAQDTCNIITDVISTFPVFPTQDGGVTIYFDASKGNQALKDYTGDIYAHTGVITDKSPSPTYWLHVVSDWGENLPKTKFTRIGDNLYKLEIPNIRSYYSVPQDEKILKIAMVIRSGQPMPGSSDYYVARNADGSDFFIPLYDNALNVKILSPNSSKVIYNPTGDTVKVCAYSIGASQMKIFLDGRIILTDTTESLHFNLLTDSLARGNHQIVAEAISGQSAAYDTASFIILPSVQVAALPAGMHPGVNPTGDSSAVFVLWDPAGKKKFVFLLGDFNDWQMNTNYLMKHTPDNHYFWLEVKGLDPHKQYAYQYLVDGQIYLADPYAHLILDPWNDKYIPKTVFPNLKPYPDKANGIVSVMQLDEPQFDWTDSNFVPPVSKNLVIYELWINDFVKDHSIVGVEQKLDYLQNLGINAIELMPFNEFEGNISWGYNPDFYFATDKYYGTPSDFKHFINECHRRGIAVIMDIVLNHSFGQSPLVQMYWDSKNNRPSVDNPWYNPTPRHPFCVGYDFNHESPATKKFVKDVLKYWLTEFHIDGFRFDLSKGFTQHYTTDVGAWSAYDQSRIDILTDYCNYIKQVKPSAYVILEHFAVDREEQVLAHNGMLLWSNSNYAAAQTLMGWMSGSDFSRIFYQAHGFQTPSAVGFFESHDEERIMYKALTWGNAYADYNVKDLNTAIEREKALVPLFFSAPGPKMIWQFGELGYDYSINYCPDGTISDNCRTSPKPLHWDYYTDSVRHSLFERYKQMIYWKETDSIFNRAHYVYSLTAAVKYVKITSDKENIVLVGNFGVTDQTFTITMPHAGLWIDLLADSSFAIDSKDFIHTYKPGEFHFFTDRYVALSPDTTAPGQGALQIKIFPNPAHEYFVLSVVPGSDIQVYKLTGERVYMDVSKSNYETVPTVGWKAGVYIVRVKSASGTRVGKVIIN